MRLLFFGEGSSDVGWDEHAGVIQILTRKVLATRLGVAPELNARSERLPHLRKRRGYAAKAEAAINSAHRLGFDGVSIVVDRDGPANRDRLKLLRKGRDKAAAEVPIPAAVGVAIETVEAWVLADEPAIGRVLGLPTSPATGPDPETLDGSPESDRHPKKRLAALLAQDTIGQKRNQERLEAIASETDVGVVERRCEKGFGRYADEVRVRLAPIFTV